VVRRQTIRWRESARSVRVPIATVELRLALKGADDEFIQSHNSSEALLEAGKIYDRAD
jgi:hypothetical protein